VLGQSSRSTPPKPDTDYTLKGRLEFKRKEERAQNGELLSVEFIRSRMVV